MLISHVPALADSHETIGFSDVPGDHPDRASILFLARRGLISGYPDGRFGPNDPLNRAAATKIAIQVAGLAPMITGESLVFIDLPSTHWSLPFVQSAVNNGITQGFEDKTFRPDTPVTRAELAVLALRAIRQPTTRVPDMILEDVKADDWFYGAALLAVGAGLVDAPAGRFRPNDVATRAEAARAFAHAMVFTPQAFDIPLAAVVEPLHGQVEIALSDSDSWTLITTPTPLPTGGRIRTGAASAASLDFPDGSGFYLDNQSELVLLKSRGADLVSGSGVEDLEVELVRGKLFGALVPRIDPNDLQTYKGYLASSPESQRGDALAAAAVQRIVASSHVATGQNLPSEVTRLLLFSSPATLEPGDKEGAELTIVLANNAGEPVTASQGPVTLQLLSDVGRFSNAHPVIPEGFQAVTVTLFPPAKEPGDAKTRVTAVAGDLSAALTIATSTVNWWQGLFSKKDRAKVRMPWAVASVRGSYVSLNVDGEENALSVLGGDASLSSLTGDMEVLQDNQAAKVTSPQAPPSNAAPLDRQAQQQWNSQRTWVANQAQRIEQNSPSQVRAEVESENTRINSLIALLPSDPVAPSIVITSPDPNTSVGTTTLTLRGAASDDVKLASVRVAGAPGLVDENGNWSADVQLQPGPNTVTAVATDGAGNQSTASLNIQFDPSNPAISLSGPRTSSEKTVRVTGNARAPNGLRSVTLNNQPVQTQSDGSFAFNATLEAGRNLIVATVTDDQGRTASESLEIINAPAAPILTLTQGPVTVSQPQYIVNGKATAQYARLQSVTVNGRSTLFKEDGSFSAVVQLVLGENIIVAEATDAAGNRTTTTSVVTLDASAPSLRLQQPRGGLITQAERLEVVGQATATTGIQSLLVNGAPVTVQGDGSFSAPVNLTAGQNVVTAVLTDVIGRVSSETRTVVRNNTPPTLFISHPLDDHRAARPDLTVTGTAAAAFGPIAGVTVNGRSMVVGSDGGFSTTIPLQPGDNTVSAQVRDTAGNTTSVVRRVTFNPNAPTITVVSPQPGQVVGRNNVLVTGRVDNRGTVNLVSVNGISTSLDSNGEFVYLIPLSPGPNTISVALPSDAGGASVTRSVIFADRPPSLTVTSPSDRSTTAQPDITVRGTALTSYGTPANVSINGLVSGTDSGGNFAQTISLRPGTTTVVVRARDDAGQETIISRTVTYMPAVPLINITSPSSGSTTLASTVQVRGMVTTALGIKYVQVNGASTAVDSSGSFVQTVELKPGANTLVVVAEDNQGGISSSSITVTRSGVPPTLSITTPTDDSATGTASLTVTGHASSSGGSIRSVRVNGSGAALRADGSWAASVSLTPGENTITVVAEDTLGGSSTATRRVTYAQGSPALDLTAPQDGITVGSATITVSGVVKGSTTIERLTVNGTPVTPGADGFFLSTVNLQSGQNQITVSASDSLNRTTTSTKTVILADQKPVISLSGPAEGAVIADPSVAVSGTVRVMSGLRLSSIVVNGLLVDTDSNGAFSTAVSFLTFGQNQITATATDSAGNVATVTRTITWSPSPLAVTIASPAANTTVITDRLVVSGAVSGALGTPRLTVNDVAVPVVNGNYSTTVTPIRGQNTITVRVTDDRNRTASAQTTVTFNPAAPILTINAPENNLTTTTNTVAIAGTAASIAGDVVVTLGTQTFALGPGGSFSGTATLIPGQNAITITARDRLGETSATRTVTYVPPPDADTSLITAGHESLTADGTGQTTITVQLRDARSINLTSTAGATVSLSTTLGTLTALSPGANGTLTATLRAGTRTGTAIVTGTVNGKPIVNLATVTLLPGPASAVTTTIAATPTLLSADGTSTSDIRIQLKDANGNNLLTGGHDVSLSVSPSTATLSPVFDAGNGTYLATLRSSTNAGSVAVLGTLNGTPISTAAAVTLAAGAPSATTSTIAVTPSAIRADESTTSTITVRLKDAAGNNVTSDSAVIQLFSTLGNISSVARQTDGSYTALISSNAAGTATITGTLNGQTLISQGTVALELVTDDPTRASAQTSTISTSTNVLPADGTSSGNITVQIKDADGNNLTVGGVSLQLSTTLGRIEQVVDNGDGTYTARLIAGTQAGTAVVSGSLGGNAILSTASVALVSGSGSAATSVMSTEVSSLTVGGAQTATISVQVKDANGNTVSGGSDVVALTTSLGTLSAVTQQANGVYTALLTAGETAGSAVITGALNGAAMSSTLSVNLLPGPASTATSVISAGHTSIAAGGTSTTPITVQLKDSFGNNTTSSGATIALASTLSTSLGAITNNGDGTYSATLTSGTAVGTAVVSGSLNGNAIASTASISIIPGPASPAISVISTNLSSATVGSTNSATITVQLKDANGNVISGGSDVIALTTNLGTLSPLTWQADGTYTATLSTGLTAGTATIEGTLNGVTMASGVTIQVLPGVASVQTSTISASPASLTADETATAAVTVQLKDAYGNNTTSGGAAVTLSTTRGTIGSVTDAGNGTYSATLTSGITPGTATITGTLGGVSMIGTATVAFTVGAPSASESTISASPTSLLADGLSTSVITVGLRDAMGNAITSDAGIVLLQTSLGSISGVEYVGNGMYTATLTAGTTDGTATISGLLNETAMTKTATVTLIEVVPEVIPPSATTSTMSVVPASITADGQSTATITIQLKDDTREPLATGGFLVNLATNLGTIRSVTDNHNGTYTGVLESDTRVGIATVTGAISGTPMAASVTVPFVPGAAYAGTSTITASPSSITANGTSTSAITVQLKDRYGNSLTTGGAAVTLSRTLGTIGAVIDNGNGTYSAVLTAATLAGPATITGSIDGTAISETATVTLTAGPPSTATTSVTASAATLTADDVSTATITVSLKDAFGNSVSNSGASVSLATNLGTIGPVTSQGGGMYTAVLKAGTLAGTAIVTGKIDGADVASTASVVFAPGAPSVATSLVTASPTTVTANGTNTSTITIQLRDAFGNNITTNGIPVTVSTTLGTLSAVSHSNNGTYTATLTSGTSAGLALVTGYISGLPIADTETVTLAPGPASALKSAMTSSATTFTVGAGGTATITVTLKDAAGNHITTGGATVALSQAPPLGTLSDVTDNGNGTYSATFTPGTTTGITTISGQVNGTALTTSVAITVAPSAGSAETSTLTASPLALTAGGSASTITVQLKDAYGNNITSGSATVTLAQTPALGTLSAVTDNGNGTYSATFTPGTSSGTVAISGAINGNAMTSAATLTISGGAASALTSIVSASTSSLTAGGAASTITVTLKDAYGNNITAGTDTVTLAQSPALGTLSSVTNNGNGTYTATFAPGTTTGITTLSGQLNGTPVSSTVAITVGPGALSTTTSTLTASPLSLVAGGSASTVTVQLKDGYGNNITSGSAAVTLSQSPTLGTLSAVTNHGNGSYSATFTPGTLPGAVIISGAIDGTAMTATASLTILAGAVSTSKSTITAAGSTITTDQSSLITVQLKDASGNILDLSGAAVTMSTKSSGTLSAVTYAGGGRYVSTLSSQSTGQVTVTAIVNGQPLTSNVKVNVKVGAPSASKSSLSVNKSSITAGGSATVTVHLYDSYDNPIYSQVSQTITLSTNLGTIGNLKYDDDDDDDDDGPSGAGYSASFSSTTTGTATITGTINGEAIGRSASVTVNPGAPDEDRTVVTVTPTSIIADGTTHFTASVHLKDKYGNDVKQDGHTVTVAITPKSKGPKFLGTKYNAVTGTYDYSAPNAGVVDEYEVMARIKNKSVDSTATFVLVAGPPSAATSTISSDAPRRGVEADNSTTAKITITLRDAMGNAVPSSVGHTVTLSTNLGTLSNVTNNGNGTYTATIRSSTTGKAVITAVLNGTPMTSDLKIDFRR